MLKLRVTHTRPSEDVPFFQSTSVFAGWNDLLESYVAQGKLLSRVVAEPTVGLPHLAMVIETTWKSVAAHEEFLAEAAVSIVRDARIAHCTQHLITVEFEREIIADEFDVAE